MMRWFRNLKTMTKLMLGFGLGAILTVFVGYQGEVGMDTIEDNVIEMYEKHLIGVREAEEANTQLIYLSRATANAVLDEDEQAVEKRASDIRKYDAAFRQHFDAFQKLLTKEDQKSVADIDPLYASVRAEQDKVIQLARARKNAEARVLLAKTRILEDEVDARLGKMIASKVQQAKDAKLAATAIYEGKRLFIFALIIVAAVIALGSGVFIAQAIAGPLRMTLSVLEAVAAGDLSRRVNFEAEDELGRMAAALNVMIENLSESMSSLAQNAETLAGAAEEMSAVSTQMNGNAEETATQANAVSAATEQVNRNMQVVATGMTEMHASIREIAKNAGIAAQIATEAVAVAESTNGTVARLGESSTEISKVIKVITSIAEQTNLLALNASIEAARAGEAGKGFAVVANEVKELAKVTAKSTEDISRKIEAIQGDTKGAVDAIQEVAKVINQINDISTTIAGAVEEQTTTTNEIGQNMTHSAKGTDEIAQNISGVAKAAQSTTEGANQMRKGAGDLARMAGDLQRLVSRFKLDQKHVKGPAVRQGGMNRLTDHRHTSHGDGEQPLTPTERFAVTAGNGR